jgi:hypothetical protein
MDRVGWMDGSIVPIRALAIGYTVMVHLGLLSLISLLYLHILYFIVYYIER